MASFGQQLKQFEVKVQSQSTAVVKKVVLEMFTRVMKRTPVDTGNARVNWEIGVNEIKSTVATAAAIEGEHQVSAQALLAGLSELSTFKAGQTVYITNNVEYIQILEDGGSKDQSPQGMVAITVREFQDIVQSVAAGII